MKYHQNAKLTLKQREYIRKSKESIVSLASRFGVTPTTIFKWKHRDDLADRSSRPKRVERIFEKWEERVIVKVRKHLKLSLDDLVLTLKRYLPKINRINCWRVLNKYHLSVLPSPFQDKGKGKFGYYLPGFLHLDLAYLPLLANSSQRRYLLVAIDRVTKLVFIMMVKGKTQINSILFLKILTKFYPYRIHRILTDNGKEFGKQFTLICQTLGIKHKKTKVKHPWTNGQVETTIKQIKQQTIGKIYYPDYQALAESLRIWTNDYNLTTKLRSIGNLTPKEKVVQYYQELTEEKRKQRFLKEPKEDNLRIHTITL